MIPGHDLALALRSAYLSMHRRADAVLARFGVTADQFVLMAAIPEGVVATQQELVRRLSSDASTVRAMLLLLEERGLVTRFAHPSDGRARCVTLTAKGRRALQRMIEASQGIRTRLLEALGPDQERLLNTLLACVTEAMANYQELPSHRTVRKPPVGAAGSANLNPSEGVRE